MVKSLLIFSFLFLSPLISDAQFTSKEKPRISDPVKIIFSFSGSIIADALGDGLCDDGHKVAGHSFQAISIGFLLPLPYLIDIKPGTFIWYLSSYTFLRISLFDPFYNVTRGLPLNYVGNTSLWDKSLQEFAVPEPLLFYARSLTFLVGIKIPIDNL